MFSARRESFRLAKPYGLSRTYIDILSLLGKVSVPDSAHREGQDVAG